MGYKKCPICDLNWIQEDEEMCVACKEIQHQKTPSEGVIKDNNIGYFERNILPILKDLTIDQLESFLLLGPSQFHFGLNYPLLNRSGEIKDNYGHNRYWQNAYYIQGKKYWVCSEWWPVTKSKREAFVDKYKNGTLIV